MRGGFYSGLAGETISGSRPHHIDHCLSLPVSGYNAAFIFSGCFMMNADTLRAELTRLFPHAVAPDDDAYLLDQRRRYRSSNVVVLLPRDTEEVQNIVRYCRQQRIAITPQGGNTGLVGGSYAQSGVLLNLSRLNRIRTFHPADAAVTVEAGCILQRLQQAAAAEGWLFPLSLASEGSCQIGGNIACNAGGLNVVRYGTMRDQVLGLEVVLPDGSLLQQLEPLHKNTSGYELKHLFIGSEGTLGIITAATVKLAAPPRQTATAWIGLDSIEAAVALLTRSRQHFAEHLVSFELVSRFALQLSAASAGLAAPTDADWHVLLELTDSLPHDYLDDALAGFLHESGYHNSILAHNRSQRADMWTLRENISAAQRGLGVSIKHDIALPISHIAAFAAECGRDLAHTFPGIRIVLFGHLGDGSLHYNTFLPQTDDSAYQQEDAVNRVVYRHVLARGGTIAAEHGIGCLKNHWLPQVRSAEELAAMRAIKAHFDPDNLFNPGKLLP